MFGERAQRMLQPNATGGPSGRIVVHSKLSDECLIGTTGIREMLGGVSQMHIWRLLNDERYRARKFPRPIVMGRRNYWRLGDMRRWINKQPKKLARAA
jgi:predicted DNA-binding transcriptional regulator AlpA